MVARWNFNEARPGDRARESVVEKFFNSDAVANCSNAIVREGIQNSLDAAPDAIQVMIRIAIRTWADTDRYTRLPKYTKGFNEHLEAESVQAKFSKPPQNTDPFRYLVFEDFGTSGLLGDPKQWWPDDNGEPNPFFNYFRAEGLSDKIEGKRGRHGVGRLVFMFASRIHAIFGLTRRDDGRQYLMGTSVLRNHRLAQKPYLPDGWFGIASESAVGLTLPVEDSAFLSQFRAEFDVSRTEDQSGLSVVVPWLSDDVTVDEVISAVLSGYFHPILQKKLVVTVVDDAGITTVIDANSIESVIDVRNGAMSTILKSMLALSKASMHLDDGDRILLSPPGQAAPHWAGDCIPEALREQIRTKLDALEIVAIRVPLRIRTKAGITADSHFDIYLQRDQNSSDDRAITFIREGIIIGDVRPRRTSGIRALVVVDEGPLATFLGDAENPSHMQWQKELVRDRYSYHAATIEYVVQSVPSIIKLLSEDQKKPDSSLLIDLFSLPTEVDDGPKVKRQRRKKEGREPEELVIDVPTTPKSFAIEKSETGFSIRRGNSDAACPPMLAIRVAYGVRRGSPFGKYDPADFRLGLDGINCQFAGCEIVDFDENWMLVRIDDNDFRIDVDGFDTNRDLHIDARVKEAEVGDAATV